MLAPVRTVAPAEMPVTLAEAKAHLNVFEDDWDELIASLIAAATGHLEGHAGILGGRCLVTQSWRQSFGGFPRDRRLRLPLAPVLAVESISYHDTDRAPQTLPVEAYSDVLTDDLGPFVELAEGAAWPATAYRSDAVSITFIAGYGDPPVVPQPIKQAILLYVGTWFEQREDVTAGQALMSMPENMAAKALLAPFRRVRR